MVDRLTPQAVKAMGGRSAARKALGYVPVPTVEELAHRGHARAVPHARGKAYTIDTEGHQSMNDAMDHNAKLPTLPPDYLMED